ncbi:MAG TPA: zf-HC2 domain-containing protein [Actinomycetota bacterium]|nr:zf-HC2 domain-containing protein [Actinomycetota bacterium]
MRCETSQKELSARLDGAPNHRLSEALESHLATCARCRSFAAGAERIRELARIEPASPVPDLVPRIMAEVQRDGRRRPVRQLVPREWRRYAAAFAAGAAAAALLVGGLPGVRRGPDPALATEIPRLVFESSTLVTSYRATFDIRESNFAPAPRLISFPVRRFVARVAFESPERFRAVIKDRTAYPAGRWPRNDLVLAVDRDRWSFRGPATCPRESLPDCAIDGRETRGVRGREPFDGDALLPADIVVPVRTLAGSDRVRLAGEGTILGRPVVIVELVYRDASPLFAYLHAGGSWRPFHPLDRVLVSLDRETWFPLAYEVRTAAGPERDRWSVQNSLPHEPAGKTVFVATATSFSTAPQPAGWRPLARVTYLRDAGFRDESLAAAASRSGSRPMLPADTGGLRPYRTGTFASGDRPRDEVLVSFVRGLTWLKIRQTRTWSQPEPFGDVGSLATPTRLRRGVAYYEPATAMLGRRLWIHGRGLDLYLESNLPRSDFLRVAASLPVRGEAAPREWLVRRLSGGLTVERTTLARARAAASFMLLPSSLPHGYRPGPVHLVRIAGRTGVTMFFRRPGTELDGVGIRLHQADGEPLPPPVDPDVLAVRVRGVVGRYSPLRAELEWVEDGAYRSLRGTALDLVGLLHVAESLR